MEEKVKNNNLKLFIYVFGALLIGFGSGFLISEGFSNKESEKKTDNIEKVDKKEEDNNESSNFKTVSKYEANAIMKQFKGIKISSERLFSNDKFSIDDINVDEMLVTALRQINIYNACSESGEKSVSLYYINNELNKYVKKNLTLNDVKSKEKNGAHVGDPYPYDYDIKVNDDKNIEVVDAFCGDTFSANDFVTSKIVDARRDNDYVYIYEKVAFGRYNNESLKSSNDNFKVDYYDNYNKKGNVIETLSSPEFGESTDDKNPNWDLYKTYKYTFKLIDDEYYFESLELDK